MRSMLVMLTLFVIFIPDTQARPVWRLDFNHSGGHATEEGFDIEALRREPGQWSSVWIDTLQRGDYKVELFHAGDQTPWFSRSYSSLYSDWSRSDAARKEQANFQESIRFPAPLATSELVISARQMHEDGQPFIPVWHTTIESDLMPEEAETDLPTALQALQIKGEPENKLDLLFIAEGFTDGQQKKFFQAAEQAMDALFSVQPYTQLQDAFNVRALFIPSQDDFLGGNTALRVNPDALNMPRYALTLETHRLYNVAMQAPYDNIVILTNSVKYSASGIFGAYAVVPVFEPRMRFLLVHELGHHLAGLADEYFHQSPAYSHSTEVIEPHEPNVTALKDAAALKWRHLLEPDTPVPTPWELERYMQNVDSESGWLRHSPFVDKIGAFQGANYSAAHYYRPALNCLMFRDGGDNNFCKVCSQAISNVIKAAATARSDTQPRSAAHAAARH